MKRFAIIFAALFLSPAFAFAAWSDPSQSPTGGNVDQPINVSGSAQEKVGGLILNSGGATNGLLIPYGKVGIANNAPTYKLDVNGSVGATAYFYTSDRSLKKDIAPLQGSLAKVMSLQGVSFAWKSDGTKSVGLVAQDVEKVYPELVSRSSSGIRSVEYGNLVAPLVEAIKEQQKEIESLRAEIALLKQGR
jgi:hypothetical protein